jgi:hypothetical protein
MPESDASGAAEPDPEPGRGGPPIPSAIGADEGGGDIVRDPPMLAYWLSPTDGLRPPLSMSSAPLESIVGRLTGNVAKRLPAGPPRPPGLIWEFCASTVGVELEFIESASPARNELLGRVCEYGEVGPATVPNSSTFGGGLDDPMPMNEPKPGSDSIGRSPGKFMSLSRAPGDDWDGSPECKEEEIAPLTLEASERSG